MSNSRNKARDELELSKEGNGPRVTYFVVRSPLRRYDRHRLLQSGPQSFFPLCSSMDEFRIPKDPIFERGQVLNSKPVLCTSYSVQYRTLVLMALSEGTEAATLKTGGHGELTTNLLSDKDAILVEILRASRSRAD